MRRKKTIKQKMFETYVLALLVVVVCFIAVNLTQSYRIMKNQITDSMTRLSGNVAERVNDSIVRLSRLSERIVFSSDVRQLFFEELADSDDAAKTYRLNNQLNAILYGIIGTKLEFYHMNLVDLSGNRFAFGQEYNYRPLDVKGAGLPEWVSEAVKKDGKLVILPMMDSVQNNQSKKVISLSRGFGARIGGAMEGAVELQLSYDELEERINSTIYVDGSPQNGQKVMIFDKDGMLVYPASLEEDISAQYRRLLENGENLAGRNVYSKNEVTGDGEYIFFSECDVSGWQVLLVVPDNILIAPILQVVLQILFLGILMMFGIAVFSKRISSAYSEPIHKLYDSVKGLTLDDLNAEYQVQLGADIDELEQLNRVFNKMVVRLHESLEDAVASRNMEMHSRMLALQAQMNPHFLYNTLAVISIMADNEEKENVQCACRNLSDMLSYISSEALNLVCFQEEMEHTESYITLIQMRYMEDIQFGIEVPEEMGRIYIPKLVVQPLVENSVKYATNTPPVWKIHLSGWIDGNRWFVRIEDNGRGFSEKVLDEIWKKIRFVEENGAMPELALNGMGLLNIYLRMHFYYKEQAVFEIENNPGQGAKIMIGGLVEVSDMA